MPGDDKECMVAFLKSNAYIFAWFREDMPDIDQSVVVHWLHVDSKVKPVR